MALKIRMKKKFETELLKLHFELPRTLEKKFANSNRLQKTDNMVRLQGRVSEQPKIITLTS